MAQLSRLMGNCLSPLRKSSQNMILRIVRKDGKILEYREPILVKDVLKNHSECAVGLTPEASSRHLPLDYELKIGKVYYLIPNCSGSSAAASNRASSCLVDDQDDQDGNKLGGIKRIKVVITKQQLRQLLKNQLSVEEVILGGLKKRRWDSEDDDEALEQSPRGGWKPNLETIPEGSE